MCKIHIPRQTYCFQNTICFQFPYPQISSVKCGQDVGIHGRFGLITIDMPCVIWGCGYFLYIMEYCKVPHFLRCYLLGQSALQHCLVVFQSSNHGFIAIWIGLVTTVWVLTLLVCGLLAAPRFFFISLIVASWQALRATPPPTTTTLVPCNHSIKNNNQHQQIL